MNVQGQLIPRMIGAARLNAATYEEVEHDTKATTQALIVVVLAAIAAGIGRLGDDDPGRGLIGGLLGGILGWAVFAALVAFVGTRLLAAATTSSNWGEVARVLGFAYTPQLLAVVGFIPIFGPLVAFVGAIWSLIASVIGVRQALEMSTGRAIAVCVIAFVVNLIVVGIILAIFGVSLT